MSLDNSRQIQRTYTDVAGRTDVGSRGVLIERRLGEIVRQSQPVIDDPRHGMALTGDNVDPYGVAPMREGIAQQVAHGLTIFRWMSPSGDAWGAIECDTTCPGSHRFDDLSHIGADIHRDTGHSQLPELGTGHGEEVVNYACKLSWLIGHVTDHRFASGIVQIRIGMRQHVGVADHGSERCAQLVTH